MDIGEYRFFQDRESYILEIRRDETSPAVVVNPKNPAGIPDLPAGVQINPNSIVVT